MTRLTGKDATDFANAIEERNRKAAAEALAREKAEAVSRGKEPFDLARLEEMCDTSSYGRLDPVDVRQERYEYMYYVQNPKLLTLKELADLITRSAW